MSERVQKSKATPQEKEAATPHSKGGEAADLSETDALLDEIDSLLDEVTGELSAEEFVSGFRQKGGQ